jgi:hypothetical protein
MTKRQVEKLPVGALLLNRQSGVAMVVLANDPDWLSVIQIGWAATCDFPTRRPRTLEHSVSKPLRRMERIA